MALKVWGFGAGLSSADLNGNFAIVKQPTPTNAVQSVIAVNAGGTAWVDQDFYISPQYNLVITGISWTTIKAVAVFYRVGTVWRMIFNFYGSLSPSIGYTTVYIAGIVFKSIIPQAISVYTHNSVWGSGTTINGYNTISLSSGASFTNIAASGDVELDAKPTAYLPAGV